MAGRTEPHKRPSKEQMDERVSIDVKDDDAEAAIEALLHVDQDAPEADDQKQR